MSSLETALSEHAGDVAKRAKGKAMKPRLIADPGISVRQLMEVLRLFALHLGTKDFHCWIAPAKYMKLNWQSPPERDFLVKVSGLAYDLAQLAPNSKLSSRKLRDALKGLLDSGDIQNQTNRSDDKFIDNADLLVRIAMSMFRNLKRDLTLREPFLKRLRSEDALRIKLVLDRLLLPKDYADERDEDEQEDPDILMCDSQSQPSKSPRDHLDDSLPLTDKDPDIEQLLDIDMGWTENILESTPKKSNPGSSTDVGFSPQRNVPKRVNEVSFRWSPSPDRDDGSEDSPCHGSPPPAPKKEKKGGKLPKSDADLLAEAEGYVPERTKAKAKPKRLFDQMKRPAASGKVLKKPAAADKEDTPGPEEEHEEALQV